jgi:hypothetical protein
MPRPHLEKKRRFAEGDVLQPHSPLLMLVMVSADDVRTRFDDL